MAKLIKTLTSQCFLFCISSTRAPKLTIKCNKNQMLQIKAIISEVKFFGSQIVPVIQSPNVNPNTTSNAQMITNVFSQLSFVFFWYICWARCGNAIQSKEVKPKKTQLAISIISPFLIFTSIFHLDLKLVF